MAARTGILYLVSGPSGSGKTTLCNRLAKEGHAHYAISCTTRAPRKGETHGTNYFFLSTEEFNAKVSQNAFLEHAQVHDNLYGTLISEVTSKIESGIDVVLDIDVQGAAQVREIKNPMINNALVDIFIMPPSETELRNRLTGRGTDSDSVIETRMRNSLEEMKHWDKYTFRLISGTHEHDYAMLKGLLFAERLRISRYQ